MRLFNVIFAHPSVPVAGASPSPHRLAVAGVPDELGCVCTVATADGDGEVTGWVIGRFLRHPLLQVFRFQVCTRCLP